MKTLKVTKKSDNLGIPSQRGRGKSNKTLNTAR